MSLRILVGSMLVAGSGALIVPAGSCAATLCPAGNICVENDQGEGSCVEHPCNLIDCTPDKPQCILENGVVKCVALEPIGKCATVRCPAGTSCYENKRGRVSCKSDCETSCGNFVPHKWKGRDDGDNCCNKCKCRNGKLRCTEKACDSKKEKKQCEGCSYNCFTHEVWSDKKREWCCKNKMLGCPTTESLALGEVCHQFCEDGSCPPINKRDECGKGECISVSGIRFNSLLTCQLPVGATCFQFCETGNCAPVNAKEHCTTGTECKSIGGIGFDSHHTCQEVLAVGDACYQFCEDGSCKPVNRRDDCPKGTECKSNGGIGFNSHETCQTL